MNLEYQGWICVLIQFLSHALGLKIVIFYSWKKEFFGCFDFYFSIMAASNCFLVCCVLSCSFCEECSECVLTLDCGHVVRFWWIFQCSYLDGFSYQNWNSSYQVWCKESFLCESYFHIFVWGRELWGWLMNQSLRTFLSTFQPLESFSSVACGGSILVQTSYLREKRHNLLLNK